MRKISKEELRHGTWFRKMMVVTVFLFIAMIAAGAAMQMAEWALSGGKVNMHEMIDMILQTFLDSIKAGRQ